MLPILMYHGLHANADARGHYDPVYSVHPDEFARQLDWLQAQDYRALRLADAITADDADRYARRVVITFDDGDISNLEVALPLLRERGMSAEFFITSDFIDQPGMLASADVRQLVDAGMGVGSHGRSHAFLEDLEPAELTAELRDSQIRLQQIAGGAIDALALPGGRGGEREQAAAAALGYRHLLGSVPGPNRRAGRGGWLQRVAVTRTMALSRFASMVRWQGLTPHVAHARFVALALPKRVLGNDGYQRLRARLL